MTAKLSLISAFFVLLILVSCHSANENATAGKLNQAEVTEKLLDANKAALKAENDQIEKLILRNNWNVIKTATGLRYQMIEKGNGIKTSIGKIVKFEFEVQLITGEIIYNSTQTGPKEFRLGSGGVESGLEEGILLLNVGDKARFIIPSYLAHGLSGDQDRIPPKATLIYTLKIIDLK